MPEVLINCGMWVMHICFHLQLVPDWLLHELNHLPAVLICLHLLRNMQHILMSPL